METGEPLQTDRILTVPNVLSIIRLIGVPIFLYVLLVLEADWWKLGALLDPLVDRLYTVATIVGFVIRGLLPWWVAALLIGRDLVLALTLSVYKRRNLPPPDVIYLGKAATFALMSAFPWVLVGQADWPGAAAASAFGYAFLIWGTAVYVWTGALYIWKAAAVARAVPVT